MQLKNIRMISIKFYKPTDRATIDITKVPHILTLKFSSSELSRGEICQRAFSRFEIIPFSPSPSGIDPTGYTRWNYCTFELHANKRTLNFIDPKAVLILGR